MLEVQVCVYLQNEDEVVDGFSALVKVVLWRAFLALVESELLDDVGVSEDPQQDFLCDLEWAEETDLWGRTRWHREEGSKAQPGFSDGWMLSASLNLVGRKRRRSHEWLTCGQEPVSRQHELRRDLHFTVGVVLEGREVGLVFVRVHLFPVPVVSCRGQKDGQRLG